MTSHGEQRTTKRPAGRTSSENLPALRFQWPYLSSPYRNIGPDDPLYMLAAWAHHHADELGDFGVRRSFYEALRAVWPERTGRKGHPQETYAAYLLSGAGATTREIADAFCVDESTARRYKREAEQWIAEVESKPPWAVVVVEGASGPPPDPASIAGLARLLRPTPGPSSEAGMSALRRAKKELGIKLGDSDAT